MEKRRVFVRYGCYLGMDYEVWDVTDSDEVLDKELYQLAYQETEGWVGSHGFAEDEEGEALEGEEGHMAVDEACDWGFELYNPKEHDGYSTGGGFEVVDYT